MKTPLHHQARIVKIDSILPHNNADSLELIPIGDYQIVTRKEQFKIGDLGVYIHPDSVVPQTEPFRFIWEPYISNYEDGKVPDKKRRITVRKFRGQWSEGLLLPLSDFTINDQIIDLHGELHNFLPKEDEDVSERLGIIHYEPESITGKGAAKDPNAPGRRYPKTIKGWCRFLFYGLMRKLGIRLNGSTTAEEVSFFAPQYDVNAFKDHSNAFIPGETVIITEKIHGTNARYTYIDDKMYAGSHYQWKTPESNDIYRRALNKLPWIEEICREFPNYVFYGELVPAQKGFDYGCKKDQIKFFLFDIRKPDDTWAQRADTPSGLIYNMDNNRVWAVGPWNHVPILDIRPYDKAEIKALTSGPSKVDGATHLREGVVVQPMQERHQRGVGRVKLKIVSNEFLEKDTKLSQAME